MSAADVRTAVAAAAATLLGSLALSPVLSSPSWRRPVVDAVLLVLGCGLALRWAGQAVAARAVPGRPAPASLALLGVVLVPAGQLAALVAYLTREFTSADLVAGLIPTPEALAALRSVLADGTAEVREQVAPATPVPELTALIVLFVGLVAVVVDVLTVAGERAAVAGLALLVLVGVPVFTLGGDIGLLPVVAPAAALALLLWADQSRRLEAGRRSSGTRGTGGGTAVRIGLAAVVAGVLLGGALPTLREATLSGGTGGPGGSTGTALDPVAAMVGQLTRTEPVDLLRVETDVEDPGYLRAVTLDRYDTTQGWLRGETGPLLPLGSELPVRHPEDSGREVTATVEAVGHDDAYLPVPVSPASVRMVDDRSEAEWGFDRITGAVLGEEATSEDRRYEVRAAEVRPTPEELAAAPPLREGDVQQRFFAIPADLHPDVRALTAQLTQDVEGGYAEVRAILDFLTDRTNGFGYALSTEPGTSGDDLADFLTERRGYCEQYAGAMAVMVRVAGLPSRVALGYTAGTVQEDGSRLVTSDDAHAWVEVYFSGLGWVPFDPTPIDVDRRADLPWAPRVAVEDLPEEGGPGFEAVPLDSTTLIDPVGPLGPDVIPEGLGDAPQAQATGSAWPVRAGLVLLVLAAAAAPAGTRVLQRRRRLATGTARSLWDEVTATADDLGVARDPAWTPREAGRALAARTAASESPAGAAGAEAIGRLARAEELASYGPASAAVDEELGRDVRTARRGLLATTDRRTRLRAAVWPASVPAALLTGAPAWARRPGTQDSRRPGGRRLRVGGAEGYWS